MAVAAPNAAYFGPLKHPDTPAPRRQAKWLSTYMLQHARPPVNMQLNCNMAAFMLGSRAGCAVVHTIHDHSSRHSDPRGVTCALALSGDIASHWG
jgi:hypothetical protein